ncbi:MAG: hypothetical protein ACXVPU_14255 [Bacteroidia bacterium]
MKKILFAALLIIFSGFCFAQDTIIKYNGEIIQAKITEVTPTQIKFKKFDFQDGPLYVENKSDIKMVKYSNGIKEEFQKEPAKPSVHIATTDNIDYYGGTVTPTDKIDMWGSHYKIKGRKANEREVQDLLLSTKDKKIMGLVAEAKNARKMEFIGFAAIPLGIASIYALGSAISVNRFTGGISTNKGLLTLSGVCFVGAIVCPIVSGVNHHKKKNYNRAAVKLYNEKF